MSFVRTHMNAAPHPSFRARQNGENGVVLLEALIAILIFSLGVLGIVGLQAAMIKNAGDARYRVDAAYIAQQRLGAMAMDQSHLAAYEETGTDISTLLPDGTRDLAYDANTRIATVTVFWQQPGSDDVHKYETAAMICGGVPLPASFTATPCE